MVKVEQFECNSIYLQSSIGLLGFNKLFKLKKSKEIFFSLGQSCRPLNFLSAAHA